MVKERTVPEDLLEEFQPALAESTRANNSKRHPAVKPECFFYPRLIALFPHCAFDRPGVLYFKAFFSIS